MVAKLHPRGPLLASVVIGLACFLWFRDAAILLPHQGVQAVRAASSLMAGEGLRVTPELPYAKYGPLYPVLLAGAGRLGMPVHTCVYAVNALAMGLLAAGMIRLGRAGGLRHAWLLSAALCGAATTLYQARSARPDLLVTALGIWALASTVEYVGRPRTSWLALAAGATALAATGRYMALLTVTPAVAAVLLTARSLTLRRRVYALLAVTFSTAVPLALWLARNRRLTGFWSGASRSRERLLASGVGWDDHLFGILVTPWVDALAPDANGIRQVVYSENVVENPVWVTLATVVWLAGLLGLLRRRRIRLPPDDRRNSARVAVGAFSSIYLVMLFVIWTFSNNDPIQSRYLMPVYPALLLWLAERLATRHGSKLLLGAALIAPPLVANLAKLPPMLGDEPPGPRYANVVTLGSRGLNWGPLAWDEVEGVRVRGED